MIADFVRVSPPKASEHTTFVSNSPVSRHAPAAQSSEATWQHTGALMHAQGHKLEVRRRGPHRRIQGGLSAVLRRWGTVFLKAMAHRLTGLCEDHTGHIPLLRCLATRYCAKWLPLCPRTCAPSSQVTPHVCSLHSLRKTSWLATTTVDPATGTRNKHCAETFPNRS